MFRFRQAVIKDVSALIRLMRNTTYAQYVYPGYSFAELKDIVADSMQSRTYLVCIDSGSNRIIGYFIIDSLDEHYKDMPKRLKINKKYAYNAGVGIHSDFRGKGLATKLTDYSIKVAKGQGFLGMYATVASNNDASISLHEKCGFHEIARHTSKIRPKGIKNVVFEIKF